MRSAERKGPYRFDVRRTPTSASVVLYAVEACLLAVLVGAYAFFDVNVQAFWACTLLAPRAGRLCIHRTNAFTRPSTERDEVLAFIRCGGVPARCTVELLAFCFACAGAMLLVVGGLTTVEEGTIQFLHDALPAQVSLHLAVVGVLLLLSAGIAWAAAFTASVNMCLVGMIGTLGGTALIWGSMLVFPAQLTLEHWRAATALGHTYLFADDAL